MSTLETKLRALVAALDDSALEALASKGLLRRAQKDLERGIPVHIKREDPGALYITVDQFEVALPEAGPAKAKCSCPAAGVCQHVLTAVLFIQREGTTVEKNDEGSRLAPADEKQMLSFTREQLEDWAGKASFRAALQIASQSAVEIDSGRGLVIRFPSINAQCHYASGGGLDGIIVSGNAKDEKRIAVAAVIAFQKFKGLTWESPEGLSSTSVESEGAPRSRSEVLAITGQLLAEVLENGLARVSSSTQQRFATLAVSATGVNLPRLALLLRSLSDECALVVARDARSDLGRMFNRMAQANALCSALLQGGADPRPDLVGWHRTRYDEVGHLDLFGIAAWPWRTASGYAGLTLLFWDAVGKRWNSWSESRPSHQSKDFQPLARFTQPGPWEGAESPRQLARSCFRLMNARRNPSNRLSGSSKSRVLVTGTVKLNDLALRTITDWTQLQQPVDSQVALGLKESNPLDSIFALKPAAWAHRGYNAVTQVFSWMLLDSQQRPLMMEVAFEQFSEPAIKYLEGVAVESLQAAVIIGRVQRTPRGLSLHPFSIHLQNGDVSHLHIDNAKVNSALNPAGAENNEDEEFDGEEENESSIALSPSVGRLLDEVDEALLVMAETGIAGINQLRIERLRQIIPRAERIGLQGLASGLEIVVAQPQAGSALRCYYLSQLFRRAMPMSM